MNDDMPIGINPIIINEKGQILLGKRKNIFGDGTYGLPGGKLKQGETFEECAIREIKEETGLDVKIEDIEIINIANTITTKHFVQIGVLVKKYSGILEVIEKDKCDELRFFDLDNLPELFIGTKPNIELFKENKMYDEKANIKL